MPGAGGGAVVDVRAAGVNFADVLIRRGLYPQMPELPYVLGSEVAGELDGRRVVASRRARAGGYAERVEVDPDWAFPLPEQASFAAGASFLLTYLTAYIPLYRQVRVTSATTVLVHAGSGGVGSAAIQLAKNLGATRDRDREHATRSARSPAPPAPTRRVGYDEIDDLRVDVVLDPVGGEIFTRSLPLLNPLGHDRRDRVRGRALDRPERAVARRPQRVGRRRLPRPADAARARVRPRLRRTSCWRCGRRGAIDPLVGSTFPLARGATRRTR